MAGLRVVYNKYVWNLLWQSQFRIQDVYSIVFFKAGHSDVIDVELVGNCDLGGICDILVLCFLEGLFSGFLFCLA